MIKMSLEKLPYKKMNLKTQKILEQLTISSRALAELKGYANTISNQHILINMVTINEAKDSSEIENIVTTHDEIYKVLINDNFICNPNIFKLKISFGYSIFFIP